MISLEDRQALARDIDIAHTAGAWLKPPCETVGIDLRTMQRWQASGGLVDGDHRPLAVRPIPNHALSETERAAVLTVANEPRFAAEPPLRIVPMLADEGIYLASESTFRRIPHEHGKATRRSRERAPKAVRPPTTHIATADQADHAQAEGIAALSAKPVLHDNGSTLKATTVLAILNWLGVKPSYSRPQVSNDNAYAESLFRTAKYRPEFPSKGFADLNEARAWAASFVHWYNVDHRTAASVTSALNSVSLATITAFWRPDMRSTIQARKLNLARWSSNTRNCSPVGAITLNPERDSIFYTHSAQNNIQATTTLTRTGLSFRVVFIGRFRGFGLDYRKQISTLF